MTTDIERELRELFRDKAEEAPVTPSTPTAAPRRVLRRGRLYQVGTVLGSAALVLALLVGSVAGLNAVLRGRDDPFVTGRNYEVFERTATVEAFTVTGPSDWYLANQWPLSMQIAVETSGGSSSACVAVPGNVEQKCEETPGEVTSSPVPVPHGLPMLQLANEDLGLDFLACGRGLPSGMAVLYVAMDYERAIAGIADPSIGPFPPEPGLPQEGDGACGPGRYARFTVNGEPFFAWIGLGSGVSDADRVTVETAYETMSADDGWEPNQPLGYDTPAYVLAGGPSSDGGSWRLELRPADENVELSLAGTDPGGSAAGFTVPAVPVESCCEYGGRGYNGIAFGAVSQEATGVDFHPAGGGDPITGTIVPVPPTLASGFDVFFVEGTDGLTGDIVALGLEGSPTPPVAEPEASIVELSGTDLGHAWIARFTGAFANDSACIRVMIGEERFDPHCPQVRSAFATDRPSMSGWVTPRLHMLAGSVPLEVEGIDFVSDTDDDPLSTARCETGPNGWTDPERRVCVAVFGPNGAGTVRYLDADGNVLFEDAMAWHAEATPDAPPSKEYPWTNENTFITAAGSFQGAEWQLQVLYYRDGYRLTFDGNVLFEGRLRVDEHQVITLVHASATEPPDTIVLLLTDTQAEDVAVVHDSGQRWAGRWVPGSTANGEEARLWLIELPGRGSGEVFIDGVVNSEVSWP